MITAADCLCVGQYAHEMWIFPFAREVLRYEKMLKEESDMTGPSLWRPSYSIKLLCRNISSAAYSFVEGMLRATRGCCGRKNAVVPATEDHVAQQRSQSVGRQGSIPPADMTVKPHYDRTHRRQFLLTRTGARREGGRGGRMRCPDSEEDSGAPCKRPAATNAEGEWRERE